MSLENVFFFCKIPGNFSLKSLKDHAISSDWSPICIFQKHVLCLSCSLWQRLICIALRPGLRKPSALDIMEFDWNWKVVHKMRVNVPGLNYAHDFLLLPDYYVFHMTPFIKISQSMGFKILSGLSSAGEEMRYYPELPSRFVVIPRPEGRCKDRGVVEIDTDPFHVRLCCHLGFSYHNLCSCAVCCGGH